MDNTTKNICLRKDKKYLVNFNSNFIFHNQKPFSQNEVSDLTKIKYKKIPIARTFSGYGM